MLASGDNRESIPADPFLTITDLANHLDIDPKTVKKYAKTQGLPLTTLSDNKKGCFLSVLNLWKLAVMQRGMVL